MATSRSLREHQSARGAEGVREARRLIADFGVKGFKFHPHTGQTGVGAATRGGGGIRLKYSHPMLLHRPFRLVAEVLSTILVQYAKTLLKDKVLFGSDYPVLSPERWMEEFDKLPIKPEVRPLILKVNAARLLKL